MIREIIGCAFIAIGLIFFVIGVLGNFRLNYILNRMHSAGINDSFALACFVIGTIIINGFCITSLKLFLVMLFLYFTSPVCTHMLAKLEADTNPDLDKECEVEK